MPKTYNQRQIDQMRLEDAHTPQTPDAPDVTRFIRYFSSEEVRQIVQRLEQRVAAGKITQLKPETAYLVVQALRGWNAKPSRESIVREICGVPRGCAERCINCIGKANAVMQLYEGKAVRPSEDRSELNISLNNETRSPTTTASKSDGSIRVVGMCAAGTYPLPNGVMTCVVLVVGNIGSSRQKG